MMSISLLMKRFQTAGSVTPLAMYLILRRFTSEAAAVSAVVEQYLGLVGYGSVNPEEIMPEFIAALKDAGIDEVIAANQAQLDAWFASRTVKGGRGMI